LKAFLLAAGHGTRLRPLTDKTPKCLLPIRGKPLLEIWLETCQRFGIDDILINVHAHAEAVRDFLRHRLGPPRVRLVEEQELLGSAGTLRANRGWVNSDPFFWVFYADVLHQVDLTGMLQFHLDRSPVATLGVYKVPDPQRCGVVTVNENGVVVEFAEKPLHPRGNLVFAGLLIATAGFFDAIPVKQSADIGSDVLPKLVSRTMAYPIAEFLMDIGTVNNYRKAQVEWPGM